MGETLPPGVIVPADLWRSEIGRTWFAKGANDAAGGAVDNKAAWLAIFNEHGRTAADAYRRGLSATR